MPQDARDHFATAEAAFRDVGDMPSTEEMQRTRARVEKKLAEGRGGQKRTTSSPGTAGIPQPGASTNSPAAQNGGAAAGGKTGLRQYNVPSPQAATSSSPPQQASSPSPYNTPSIPKAAASASSSSSPGGMASTSPASSSATPSSKGIAAAKAGAPLAPQSPSPPRAPRYNIEGASASPGGGVNHNGGSVPSSEGLAQWNGAAACSEPQQVVCKYQ
jgi:hypothetical protein